MFYPVQLSLVQRSILGLVLWNLKSSCKIWWSHIARGMSEEAWTGLTWAFLVNVRGVAKAAECSVLAPNDCAVIWGAQAPAPRDLTAEWSECCGQHHHQQHLLSKWWQLIASSEFIPAGLTFSLGDGNAVWCACFGRLLWFSWRLRGQRQK